MYRNRGFDRGFNTGLNRGSDRGLDTIPHFRGPAKAPETDFGLLSKQK